MTGYCLLTAICGAAVTDSVLLLLHSEQRYPAWGGAPFARTDAWQDVRSLVPWPAGLASVSDVRYVWHRNAVLLGFAQGDQYKTLVLPLEKTGYRKRPPSSEHVTRPFVYLCPLTKKVYLLAGQVLVSIDGGATFERTLTNVTFGHVENCFTDLIHHHICVTKDLELVVMSLGSDEPAKISLKDVIDAKNITDVAKIALVMDRAGGVTVFGTGIIHLDLHDILTVEVEAREVYNEGEPLAEYEPLIDLELSNPDIVAEGRRVNTVATP
ncbi:uncharacterized protein LOC119106976 [Pollicipes pollicipes]|uniref:uncharacterized protein LOC119106976 n=1 Tax=Pollicipes pollicipes TaxID=41117 RepID=UPI0018859C2B|nr:uncharacterized protein LOC119106976 [Pollicipes pollicipes]